jgi:hypothetical protein
VREVTVKSFSMANHIRRPGFQLFSLVSPPAPPAPSVSQTFADTPCFLPDQYSIYNSVYIPFFALTILLLFVLNTYNSRRVRASPLTPISLSPSHSRSGNTPLLHPESAIWSPHTPHATLRIQNSVSPRSGVFPSVRTPNSAPAPTLRAFSRPSTPRTPGQQLLSPIILSPEDEDEELMYPAQYAVRRDVHNQTNGNAWASNQSDNRVDNYDEYGRNSSSYFLPAPRMRGADQKRWTWSVIVRGRRLRVTLRIPEFLTWRSLKALFDTRATAEGSVRGKFWRVAIGTGMDVLSVAWPPIIVWIAIARWIF